MPVKNSNSTARLLFKELPYFGINFILIHGQLNNILASSLPTKKYLERLTSFHDLDLFSLNTDSNINPDFNLPNLKIRSQCYSPHSFHVIKDSLNNKRNGIPKCSLFYNNLRSLERNLENLETHLLKELEYHFSVVGITETKITNSDLPDQLPSLHVRL